MLGHEGEVHEALHKQCKGDQVEEDQVEDVLTVFFQVDYLVEGNFNYQYWAGHIYY